MALNPTTVDTRDTRDTPARAAAGLAEHVVAGDVAERLLAQADVRLNGDRPWDLQVHHRDTMARILAKGSLGLGESYMDGW